MINYAESADEEDDEDAFNPSHAAKRSGRVAKRRKVSVMDEEVDDEDEFGSDVDFDIVEEGE